MIDTCKNQFKLSFLMLEKQIDNCSLDMWNKKVGGHIYWQQFLHTLMGIHFWFRGNNEPFSEPFKEKKYYPELEKDPENIMSKDDLIKYKNEVQIIVDNFFNNKDNKWLQSPSITYNSLTNLDIIFMQLRHIQYHVGYNNALLYTQDNDKVNWIDYFGK